MLVGRGLHLTKGPQGPRVVNRTLTDRIDVLDNITPRGLIPDIAGSATIQTVPSIGSGSSKLNGLHTTAVAADEKPTTLLVCRVAIEGAEDPAVASPCLFEGVDLDLVADTANTNSNQDVRVLVYQLQNPPIVTNGDTRFEWQFGAAPVVVMWENYSDAEEAVLISQSINSDVIVGGVTRSDLNAGGVDTSLMTVFGVAQNPNMVSASFSNGFSNQFEGTTGSDTADFGYSTATISAAAPIGTSVTWSSVNQATAVLIEIKSISTIVKQIVLRDSLSLVDFANVPRDSITTSRTKQEFIEDMVDSIIATYVPAVVSSEITIGTITQDVKDQGSTLTPLNGFHTTESDTDLLLALVLLEGSEQLEAALPVQFDGTVMDQLTGGDTGATGDNSDIRLYAYGMVSPGAITNGTTSVRWQFSANQVAVIFVNISGVNTASLDEAAQVVGTPVVNTSPTSTSVLPSAGSAPGGFLIFSGAQNPNMHPATVSGGYTEEFADETGSDSRDSPFRLDSLLSGGPAAGTVTWNSSNENSAMMIKLFPTVAAPATNNVTLTDLITVTDRKITNQVEITEKILSDSIAVTDSVIVNSTPTSTSFNPAHPRLWCHRSSDRTYPLIDSQWDQERQQLSWCDGITLGMYYPGPWDRGDFGYYSRAEVVDLFHVLKPELIICDYIDVQEAGDPSSNILISDKLNSEVGPIGNGGSWTPNDWWLRDETGARTTTFESGAGTAWHTNISTFVEPDSSGWYFCEWSVRTVYGPFYIDPHTNGGGPTGMNIWIDVLDRRVRTNNTDMDRDGQQDNARSQQTGTLNLNYTAGHGETVDTLVLLYSNIYVLGNLTTWSGEVTSTNEANWPDMPPGLDMKCHGGMIELVTNKAGFPFGGVMADGETWEDYKTRTDPEYTGFTFGFWQRMFNAGIYAKRHTLDPKLVSLAGAVFIDPQDSIYPLPGSNTAWNVMRWVTASNEMGNMYTNITDSRSFWGTCPWFDEFGGGPGEAITGLPLKWLGYPVSGNAAGEVLLPLHDTLMVKEYDNGWVVLNTHRTSSVSINVGVDIPDDLYTINGLQDPSHNDGSVFSLSSIPPIDAYFFVKPGIFAAYP